MKQIVYGIDVEIFFNNLIYKETKVKRINLLASLFNTRISYILNYSDNAYLFWLILNNTKEDKI